MATTAATTSDHTHHVIVDIHSLAHPQPGPHRHTYVTDVEARIAEGPQTTRRATTLAVHHPRAWMGIEVGFGYDIDDRWYPTFNDRADYAYERALAEVASTDLISVALLGTGQT